MKAGVAANSASEHQKGPHGPLPKGDARSLFCLSRYHILHFMHDFPCLLTITSPREMGIVNLPQKISGCFCTRDRRNHLLRSLSPMQKSWLHRLSAFRHVFFCSPLLTRFWERSQVEPLFSLLLLAQASQPSGQNPQSVALAETTRGAADCASWVCICCKLA